MNASTTYGRRAAVAILIAASLSIQAVFADTLEVTERRITSSTSYETTPTLGNDGTTDLVVFTLRQVLAGGLLGGGSIWYQPLVGGVPSGLPTQVTVTSEADDQLNDVSGDWIVFTSYDSVSSNSGSIVLYQISSPEESYEIATATIILEPKIHGSRVVWREGGTFSAMVKYYELGWLGTAITPRTLAGPVPPTFDIQIGDRFAVWAELDGDYDIYAYDFSMMAEIPVTDTAGINERNPGTSGAWIVWEQDSSSIEAMHMDTGERISLSNGAGNYNPTIDGDLIAWETDVAGNLDVWVYRRSEGESYEVTALRPGNDQYLNDVFGNMVAYVDMSGGSEDIYVATLEFIPDDPCADLGGDADGDGVCDDNDNCPLVANPSQANSDNDGLGDACDNCPIADNPIQACSDNTDCIGESNTCLVSTGFCSAQNDNDGDGAGDFCDLDDDNDEIPDVDDNCPLVANGDQADADSDGLGDVCDDTFTNSTVVTEIISAGNAAVEIITNLNPPGGNGLIAKLTGEDGVTTKVDAAVSAYEAGAIDVQTYLSELHSALDKLDAFDNQLAAKARNGQIADPEATQLTGLSALIRQAINDLIANASP